MTPFSEANRKAFNDLSNTYNVHPWQRKITAQLGKALQDRLEWIGIDRDDPKAAGSQPVKLLDYACGTGAVTQALGPFASMIRGIDISENMVFKFNDAARSSGLTEDQANAVCGDLCVSTVPAQFTTPDWQNFDVAVVMSGFHHFENPALAVRRLAATLKPETGTLVIVDALPFKFPDADQHMQHTVKHNGFTRDDMKKLMDDAGLEGFEFDVLDEPMEFVSKDGTKTQRRGFLARARHPPTALGKIKRWMGSSQGGISEQMRLRADHT